MLETYGYTINEDTIIVLRIVKDELNHAGSVKFNIYKKLIEEVKLSYSKYEADQKALTETQETERNKKKEDLIKQVEATKAKKLMQKLLNVNPD